MLRCGRRFGKDVLLQDVLIQPALAEAKPVAWFAPIYRDLAENWRELVNVLAPVIRRANATDKRIELITNGVIEMWSLDDKDSGRGRKYARVVINEASKVKDLGYSWSYVIRPTLADYAGDAWIAGTPKGFNYFSELWRKCAEQSDSIAHHYTTYDNPHIPKAEIDALQQALPERVFRQEILAEFIADGTYFQNIDACAVIDAPDTPTQHHGHGVLFGVDWGKSNDWTVITVGCRQCGRVVDWARFNQIDYHYQRQRLIDMVNAWQPLGVLAERNSIGEPNIEELLYAGVPMLSGADGKPGFNTTALTKADLIESLHLALVRDGFRVPRDYADELRAYEIEIKSGLSKFGAPAGQHDDRVMSLALCWRAMLKASGELVVF